MRRTWMVRLAIGAVGRQAFAYGAHALDYYVIESGNPKVQGFDGR